MCKTFYKGVIVSQKLTNLVKLLKKKNKGFSLIELMVVVAIIAILSTIAIPSYQMFQAKARQKEGFALMGGYYSAAHAARAEYSQFPGNWVGTGFAPTGTLNYNLRSADNGGFTLPYMQTTDAACVTGTAACACGGACMNFKEWKMGIVGMAGLNLGYANPMTAAATAGNTFLIAVAGVPSTKSANIDEYKMDHEKTVEMVTDGLK